MGWTSLHRDPGQTDREFFTHHYADIEIVESATVNGVFYAATRRRGETDGPVSALVVLVRRLRGHHGNFAYKAMDESQEPFYYDAPARVLDALDPTENEHALAWREGVRSTLAQRALAATVRPGDQIQFEKPIRFANGRTLDVLTFLSRSTFTDSYGLRYRVPRWRTASWSRLAASSGAH